MCGIYGYVGLKGAVDRVLSGLHRLEYRGYDSSGVAQIEDGSIVCIKRVGKVGELEKAASCLSRDVGMAIAHTRWATHGAPSEVNAHPHLDGEGQLALIHNGIIENHQALRAMLQRLGVVFVSDTDSEVIAQLIAHSYRGDLLEAVKEVLGLLQGAFAVALIHRDYPKQILAFAHQAPLAIGLAQGESFISSDPHAFSEYTREVLFLSDGEIALVGSGKAELYSAALEPLARQTQQLAISTMVNSKGDFPHYTLKEIWEQPTALRATLQGRYSEQYGTALLSEEVEVDPREWQSIERILLLACGTSWHAGYVASYLFEELARIPAQVEIASEFRYKNPIVSPGTLVVAISQSGETADTLAALHEVQAKGCSVLGIYNVESSMMAREVDQGICLRAGPEIGVCSTKAFTSQVALLSLLALQLARMRHLSKEQGRAFLQALSALPSHIEEVLQKSHVIESVAKRYAHYDHFFFMGRRYMYPTAMEGALKLKEIAYINANAYAAGEMKHGPIALIGDQCPTLALCCNGQTYDKFVGNMTEVHTRKGPLIAVATEKQARGVASLADDLIVVPSSLDACAPLPVVVALQLFAYYVAKERGLDIDQPRNLAKSVTVE